MSHTTTSTENAGGGPARTVHLYKGEVAWQQMARKLSYIAIWAPHCFAHFCKPRLRLHLVFSVAAYAGVE